MKDFAILKQHRTFMDARLADAYKGLRSTCEGTRAALALLDKAKRDYKAHRTPQGRQDVHDRRVNVFAWHKLLRARRQHVQFILDNLDGAVQLDMYGRSSLASLI